MLEQPGKQGKKGNSNRSARGSIFRWSKSKTQNQNQKKTIDSAVPQPVVQQKVVTYAKNPAAKIVTKAMDPELIFLSLKVVHHLQNNEIILPIDEKVKWQDVETHNPKLSTSRKDVEFFRHKVFKTSSLDAFAQRLVISVRQNHQFIPKEGNE